MDSKIALGEFGRFLSVGVLMEARVYDRWEEVAEPSEKGGKMMYYYVVGCGGRSDLAIVGREKRHGYVSYTVVPQFLKGLGVSPPGMKLRKRKDVVARLRSLISGLLFADAGLAFCVEMVFFKLIFFDGGV